MMLADIYDALNRLFGEPSRVVNATYTRTEVQFQHETMPLLDEISTYISPGDRVLIVGCGNGAEVEWFARQCGSVAAVDVSQDAIKKTAERSAGFQNVECIMLERDTLPFENNEFDFIFMHNVCEHLIGIEFCFSEYFRVLRPGKIMVNAFAPLFYSPYGAHLQDALKVPWGHLIFGLRAVVDVRNRYYPGRSNATDWAGLGLNRLTERRYRKIVRNAGFRSKIHTIRTSKDLPLVSQVPLLRNLFIFGVKSLLVKPFATNAGEGSR